MLRTLLRSEYLPQFLTRFLDQNQHEETPQNPFHFLIMTKFFVTCDRAGRDSSQAERRSRRLLKFCFRNPKFGQNKFTRLPKKFSSLHMFSHMAKMPESMTEWFVFWNVQLTFPRGLGLIRVVEVVGGRLNWAFSKSNWDWNEPWMFGRPGTNRDRRTVSCGLECHFILNYDDKWREFSSLLGNTNRFEMFPHADSHQVPSISGHPAQSPL